MDMSEDLKRKHPVVYLDTARDRNAAVAGRRLLTLIARRIFIGAAIAAGGLVVVWAPNTPPARLMMGFAFCFLGFSLAFLILYGGALLGDLQVKRGLADQYGLDIRFGLDTHQRRVMRIVDPPADLRQRIMQALEAYDQGVRGPAARRESIRGQTSPPGNAIAVPRNGATRTSRTR